MKKIKTKIVMILTLSLLVCGMLFSTTQISAVSDPINAPSNWAFEESSVELNDAIVAKYPELDNGDGFVTKTAANAMTGTLEIDGENIGGTLKGIENFTSLTELYLPRNNLSGEIPIGLGNLSNLTHLNLSHNSLSEEIPSSLGNLSNLMYLNLSLNPISGEIPNSLGNLGNLVELNLNGSILDGGIPSSLGNLSNLMYLDLSHNPFGGEIPSSLGNLNNLIELHLSYTSLKGGIPSSLGNLSNLDYLRLNGNQLSGEVPSSLGDLNNLTYLYLNDNQLSGEIPSSLSNLSNLFAFYLGSNQFTSIPPSIYDLLSSVPNYNLENLVYTNTLTTVGSINTTYEFDALPAYEQFPNYGVTFTYDLYLPDGTSTIIDPSIVNGKVVIAGNELSQVGNYTLYVYGINDNYNFSNMLYTTNFSVEETSTYVGANANGEQDKVTSNTITIDLSKALDAGELTMEDILLTDSTKTLTTITKDSLASLGNGIYELAISGTWDEGTNINVMLTKMGVVFTPDTHTVTLHKKLNTSIESNESNENNIENNGNNSDNNTGAKGKHPQTGDTNFLATIMFGAGLLISGGYLITRKNEKQ